MTNVKIDLQKARHMLDVFAFMVFISKKWDHWGESGAHNMFYSKQFYQDPMLFHFFELYERCSGRPFFADVGKHDAYIEVEKDTDYEQMSNTIAVKFYSFVSNGDGTFLDLMLIYDIHHHNLSYLCENNEELDKTRDTLYNSEEYHHLLPGTTESYLNGMSLNTDEKYVVAEYKFWFEKRIFDDNHKAVSHIDVIVSENIDDYSGRIIDDYSGRTTMFSLLDFRNKDECRDYEYFKNLLDLAEDEFKSTDMDVFFNYWHQYLDKEN